MIDVVIIDTYPVQDLCRLAIDQAVKTGIINRVHTFSHQPIYSGEIFYPIRKIESVVEYSHIMLNVLPCFIDADHVLVVQWDGMPISAEGWSPEFFNYDYIGAPWSMVDEPSNVGNGGFSLRSRALFDTLRKLRIRCDTTQHDGGIEDLILCKTHRTNMENAGCRFAPTDVARRFSVENVDYLSPFGFHGVFNLPKFLNEIALINFTDELVERTPRDLFIINFLIACINKKYDELYGATINSLESAKRFSGIQALINASAVVLPGF